MIELRRTKVGSLREEDGFVSLHELSDAVFKLKGGDETALRRAVRPIEDCIGPIKRIHVRDSAVDALCHGARLAVPGVLSISQDVSKGDTVVLMSGKGELIATGKALLSADELQAVSKGLAATVDRVIMTRGTYPVGWRHRSATQSVEQPRHQNET
jgi:H/ACA ribonucleoprotein complex subunit 4